LCTITTSAHTHTCSHVERDVDAGFELAFWSGTFTTLLKHDVIGLVMAFTGLAEVVTGWGLGRLADACGRTVGFMLGFGVYGVGLIGTYFLRRNAAWSQAAPLEGAPYLAFACAICFGVGDSAFNTQTYALLSDKMGDAHGFTLFNLAQNAGSAFGFLIAYRYPLSGLHSDLTQLVLQGGVMVVATMGAVVVDQVGRRDSERH